MTTPAVFRATLMFARVGGAWRDLAAPRTYQERGRGQGQAAGGEAVVQRGDESKVDR